MTIGINEDRDLITLFGGSVARQTRDLLGSASCARIGSNRSDRGSARRSPLGKILPPVTCLIISTLPMANARHADVFKHLVIDFLEQFLLYIAGIKGVGILSDSIKPGPDAAHTSSSSSVFASSRTGVSKPSVNQS